MLLALARCLVACSEFASHDDGTTPIKYEVCDGFERDCKVTARFDGDMTGSCGSWSP
jgi:hypothetical protein